VANAGGIFAVFLAGSNTAPWLLSTIPTCQ